MKASGARGDESDMGEQLNIFISTALGRNLMVVFVRHSEKLVDSKKHSVGVIHAACNNTTETLQLFFPYFYGK